MFRKAESTFSLHDHRTDVEDDDVLDRHGLDGDSLVDGLAVGHDGAAVLAVLGVAVVARRGQLAQALRKSVRKLSITILLKKGNYAKSKIQRGPIKEMKFGYFLLSQHISIHVLTLICFRYILISSLPGRKPSLDQIV